MARSGVSLLPSLIEEAVKKEASDIILVYGQPPVLKVEGKLLKMDAYGELSDADLTSLAKDILPSGKIESLQRMLQVDFAYSLKESRFRVNLFYQRGHISIVMRYVRSQIRSIEDLGLPEIVKELIGHDNGLILMVGPTGSGKSTSLAAMVQHINENSEKHIITIEDPVEYIYESKQSVIQQREIGVDAVDFPTALRATLREAPDVILLGEMRDLESISTAVTVAETGHLVLSTIHASSAPGTIDRIVDIFPAEQKDQIRIQLSDILIAILNQRLIPKADGSGYALLVEVMTATPAVRNAIRTANSAELPSIIQNSSAEGMHLLDEMIIKAVRRGDISKEMAIAYANDRNVVKKGMSLS